MHFIAHSCLDIIDDKSTSQLVRNIKQNSKFLENFLGYLGPALLPESDYSVFGWLGYTGVKILAVITENYDSRNEEKIRAVRNMQFLEEVQKLYRAVKNNPFYNKTDFASQKFKKKLNEATYILN